MVDFTGLVTVKIMLPSLVINASPFSSGPALVKVTTGSFNLALIVPEFLIVKVNTTLSPG